MNRNIAWAARTLPRPELAARLQTERVRSSADINGFRYLIAESFLTDWSVQWPSAVFAVAESVVVFDVVSRVTPSTRHDRRSTTASPETSRNCRQVLGKATVRHHANASPPQATVH